jgi:hypothetical protein
MGKTARQEYNSRSKNRSFSVEGWKIRRRKKRKSLHNKLNRYIQVTHEIDRCLDVDNTAGAERLSKRQIKILNDIALLEE